MAFVHESWGWDELTYGYHDGTGWILDMIREYHGSNIVPHDPSVAIDASGQPHIIHTWRSLRHHGNCDVFTLYISPWRVSPLALDNTGAPHISYIERESAIPRLKHARWICL